ncbi:hypothetical protein BH09BAC6_BH09BAC6_26420 [soil metagenome]|jgi:mono/diheme cytochrome c family protein
MKFIKKLIVLSLLTAPFCLQAQNKIKAHKKTTGGPVASIARGKLVYAKQCLSCHQVDGAGVPRLNPPLINTTYVLGDKATIIKIVMNGFKEDVEINGQYYSNVMPPHDTMNDQEIADVLTYVRKSFGNKAGAVTVADVKKTRASK